MKSMTGFGRATCTIGRQQLTVQISSVNRKGLDLKVVLPDGWQDLETQIAERIRQDVFRGTVYVKLELSSGSSLGSLDFDTDAASAWLDRLSELSRSKGHEFVPDASVFASVAGMFRTSSSAPDVETVSKDVMQTVDDALMAFLDMREKEGTALLADFSSRISTLQQHLEGVSSRAPLVTKNYRENLHRRLREAGLELNLEDERVLKEVALFADRCDINEEITRLTSHYQQLLSQLNSEGEIGRKSEFILQEIGREIHTIGSKANDLELSKLVIEMKNELERVREQIANVE